LLESLLQSVSLTPTGILWLIAVIAMLESLAFVGLLLPGVALLFALAVMAGSADISLWLCLLSAFIGAVCGDGISFLLGRYASVPLRRIEWLRRNPQWLQRGEAFFQRWGGLSIVTGRFVGPVRPVIPFVAGSCGMPGLSFSCFNLISALGWAPLYLLPGYLTGKGLTAAPSHIAPLLWATAALLFTLLLFQQLHHRLQPHGKLHALWSRALPTPWPPGPTLLLLGGLITLTAATLLSLDSMGEHINAVFFTPLKAAGDALPALALCMTLIGDLPLVAGLALLCALFGQIRGDRGRGWGVAAGVAGIMLLNYSLKQLFGMPRPEASGLSGFSYPSGHASAAATFFTLTAVWMLHNRVHRSRHLGYLCTIPLMLAVALSRPMLGVHWILDVVAGVAEALIITALYRIWLHRWPSPVRIPLGWAGVLCVLAGVYVILMFDTAAGRYPGG